MVLPIAPHIDELLQDLVDQLQIPQSRYEAAERSYKSVGRWLNRPESILRNAAPNVYVQGSFRLGTPIRPFSKNEDYDLDLVCELNLSKSSYSQSDLKSMLGRELKAYATSQHMKPPEEGKRCWTQEYADGAQFHIDTLPAIPDAIGQRALLEARALPSGWTDSAIAITDINHANYKKIADLWPHSNPKGYAKWFRSRMSEVFQSRRRALALEERVSKVEDIPEYRVRTPLQSVVQILKQHRDVMFEERADDKPISIILTTLAAHAYDQQTSLSGTLYAVLDKFDERIHLRNGIEWIANPTDESENFADRWPKNPERKAAFYEWLDQVRADFALARDAANKEKAFQMLQPGLGDDLVEAAQAVKGRSVATRMARGLARAGRSIRPMHRQKPPWTHIDQGVVQIEAKYQRRGFRSQPFESGAEVPNMCELKFEATTNIPKPFQVYWQVVNTGAEAAADNQLRGGFDEGEVSTGTLKKSESGRYKGLHSIECFVIKEGYLAARSGQFVVKIA